MRNSLKGAALVACVVAGTGGVAAADCAVTVNYANNTTHDITVTRVRAKALVQKKKKPNETRQTTYRTIKEKNWTLARKQDGEATRGRQVYYFKGKAAKQGRIQELRVYIVFKINKEKRSVDYTTNCGASIVKHW